MSSSSAIHPASRKAAHLARSQAHTQRLQARKSIRKANEGEIAERCRWFRDRLLSFQALSSSSSIVSDEREQQNESNDDGESTSRVHTGLVDHRRVIEWTEEYISRNDKELERMEKSRSAKIPSGPERRLRERREREQREFDEGVFQIPEIIARKHAEALRFWDGKTTSAKALKIIKVKNPLPSVPTKMSSFRIASLHVCTFFQVVSSQHKEYKKGLLTCSESRRKKIM